MRGGKAFLQVTFPDGYDLPAEGFQFLAFAIIAGYVPVEFGLPEGGVVLGKGVAAFWAAMPETAVDEYRHAFADEGDVGTNARNEEFGMRSAELRNTLPTGRVSAFGGCGLMSPLLTRGLVQVNAVVDTVAAVAGVPEGFAEQDLGLGVLGPVGTHHARDGFGLWRGRSFVADIHR